MIEWGAIPFSLGYRLLREGVSALLRRRQSAEQILEARKKWEPLFRKEVYRCWKDDLRKDVIVVDLARMREYDTGTHNPRRRRISSSFKVGLMQCSSDDFSLALDIGYLKQAGDKVIEVEHDDPSEGVQKLWLIGFVRYEHVVDVAWDGDKFTNLPVIYCRFWGPKGQPYSHLSYCRAVDDDDRFPPRYFEVIDFEKVKRRNWRKISREAKRNNKKMLAEMGLDENGQKLKKPT